VIATMISANQPVLSAFESVAAAAPARIDFTGCFTDVEPFCGMHVATHVNAALGIGTNVQIRLRTGDKIHVTSMATRITLTWDALGPVPSSARLLGSVINGLMPGVGMDITISADMPVGAGLGSSGSLTVALTAALQSLQNGATPPAVTAELAASSERRAGIRGGRQDQYAAAFGGVNEFNFERAGCAVPRPLTGDTGIRWLNRRILVAHARGRRESTVMVGSILDLFERGDQRVSNALFRLNALSADLSLSLTRQDLSALMDCIHEVRAAQEQLHPDIRDPKFTPVLAALARPGLAAAKYLGGGGRGGCMLLVLPAKNRALALNTLRAARLHVLQTSIAACGVTVSRSETHQL
jgi:D-glycero-alpha-D-manno-heptose-7-phosphate kinase